ncbi:TPA: PIN-like domain-containing protein [Serratia liquefaciens]
MKTIFESRYNKDANYYNELLSNSTFILDTNVLLSLYRYSESTRDYFLDTLERVKEKLWMPNQVGNEFFTNRLVIISEQIKSYTAFKKEFEELQRKLENKKSHPFIHEKTSKKLNSALDDVYHDLKESQDKYECLINEDIVLSRILDLYDNRVGTSYSEEEIENLIKVGRERYSKQIPPGYMDFAKNGSGKNDDDLHGYNKIRPYGDFIIWKQAIDHAKDKTNIIIITDDIKEDWYVRAQGKTIGPRYELLAEFKELTGQTLHVYQSDMFIERITTLLGIVKNQGAVDEIKASNIKIMLNGHNLNEHNISKRISWKNYIDSINSSKNEDINIVLSNENLFHIPIVNDEYKEDTISSIDKWLHNENEQHKKKTKQDDNDSILLKELQFILKKLNGDMSHINSLIDKIINDGDFENSEIILKIKELNERKTLLSVEIDSIKLSINKIFNP